MKHGERIVEVDCITHVYPDMTKVQICGLDFIVNQGERVGILGANGCGKTTLLRHLLGVLVPKDGSVRVFGSTYFGPSRSVDVRPCSEFGLCPTLSMSGMWSNS